MHLPRSTDRSWGHPHGGALGSERDNNDNNKKKKNNKNNKNNNDNNDNNDNNNSSIVILIIVVVTIMIVILIIIMVINSNITSVIVGKGQMGSALMGSLHLCCFLTEGLFGYSR